MHLGVARLVVRLVVRQLAQLGRDLIHRRRIEAVLNGRGDALPVRVEGHVRPRAAGDVLHVGGVDRLQPDDRARGGLRDVELHRAGDDAVHLPAEHPGVVAKIAVQGVEHGGVAAELHVLRRDVEADLGDDATIAVHGKERVFLIVGGELLGDGGERALGRVLRRAGERILAARAHERILNPLVDRSDEERVQAAAPVDLQLPADDLAVARELFVHRDRVAPVVLPDGEEHDVEPHRHHDADDEVPGAREEHHCPPPSPTFRGSFRSTRSGPFTETATGLPTTFPWKKALRT